MFQVEPIDAVAAIWLGADVIAWIQFARLRGAERVKVLIAALMGLLAIVSIVAARLAGIV